MFRFYSHRDRLIYLVMDGKINDTSITFNFLHKAIVTTIALGKHFMLERFLFGFSQKKLDKPNESEDFLNDLENQCEEVKEIAAQFSKDLLGLMLYNEPLLLISFKTL